MPDSNSLASVLQGCPYEREGRVHVDDLRVTEQSPQAAEVVDRVAQRMPRRVAELVWVHLAVVSVEWTARSRAQALRHGVGVRRPSVYRTPDAERFSQVLCFLVIHAATVGQLRRC
jgi:hypothetical protein